MHNPKASLYDDEQKHGEEKEEIFDPTMKVTVSLSRYSPGGWCWLQFDGARSTVLSKPKEVKQVFNDILNLGQGIPEEKVTV